MPLHQLAGARVSLGQSTAAEGGTLDTRPRKAYTATTSANSPAGIYPADTKEAYFPSTYENGTRAGATHGSAPTTTFYSDDTTLSTFLHQLFQSAKESLSSSSLSSSNLVQSASALFPFSSTTQASFKVAATLWWSKLALPSASSLGFAFLCSLWYMSSAVSSNTGKSILTKFKYPVTLTFIQFAFVAGYCVLFLAMRERVGGMGGRGSGFGLARTNTASGRRLSFGTAPGWGIKKPTRSMFVGTFVMSCFQIAGHIFSSMAIARVPVSTVHTIKALSPLFTVASYAVLFRVRYGPATYLALAPLTLGVMLACSFDLRANAFGFLCALGSTIIFVSQNIFSKKLLPKESSSGSIGVNNATAGPSVTPAGSSAKLDKLNLLFYSSGMAFFLMIPLWLFYDFNSLITYFSSSSDYYLSPSHSSSSGPISTDSHSLVFYFFLNGTVHFAQNLLAFSILARTSPVTYSIASLIKRIAVICLAIIWSGQHVSFVQGCGMAMTFFGLWMYNRAKGEVDQGEIKRGKLEKTLENESFLPTTADNLGSFGDEKGEQRMGMGTRVGEGDGAFKDYSMPGSNGYANGGHYPGMGGPPPSTVGVPPPPPHSTVPITLHAGGALPNYSNLVGVGGGSPVPISVGPGGGGSYR